MTSLLVIMWFLFGGVSSSPLCLGYAALLAYLSRRLIGELIGYHAPASVRPQFQTSSPKTTCPIEAKFYVEPPCVGVTKVCSRHLGHMPKMAATPIYGKIP